uniref:Uncharacterized protein n=1 Tax=Arundo donax TaxID=35708 RepID=A0A0A9BVF8_ARUDO
MFKLEAIR